MDLKVGMVVLHESIKVIISKLPKLKGSARSRRVETPAPDYLITTVRCTRATLHIPVWYHREPDCGGGAVLSRLEPSTATTATSAVRWRTVLERVLVYLNRRRRRAAN
ncbi:hypothetical protein J6590_088843 [Homalodisca vitripennis]|nr:hypothetical protein J6590_088843 [Homalodisca vitripennis]